MQFNSVRNISVFVDGNLNGLEGPGVSSVYIIKRVLCCFGRYASLIYGDEITFMKLE